MRNKRKGAKWIGQAKRKLQNISGFASRSVSSEKLISRCEAVRMDLEVGLIDGAIKRSASRLYSSARIAAGLAGMALVSMGGFAARHMLLNMQSKPAPMSETSFKPKNGIESVLVKPGPPTPLAVIPAPSSPGDAQALFIYSGSIPTDISYGSSSEDGWVYGAKLAGSYALPTGLETDIVKGRLLHGSDIAAKLHAADKLHHFTGKQGSPVRRGVVHVVKKDGTSMKAHWYYRNVAPVTEIIPRRVLFGNPTYAAPSLSPDGHFLAYLMPDAHDILNVFVRRVDEPAATPNQMTFDNKRGIRSFQWSKDGERILYAQDKDGDENFHLYSVLISDPQGSKKDLTPYPGVKASTLITDPHFPKEILIGLNKRMPQIFDMYRIRLDTGEVTLEVENPGDVIGWLTNVQFQIAGAIASNPASGETSLRVKDKSGEFRQILSWDMESAVNPVGFNAEGDKIYATSNLGRDKAAFVLLDAKTGKETEVLYAPEKADASEGVLFDETTHKPLVAASEYLYKERKWFDADMQKDFAVAETIHPDRTAGLASRNRANTKWVVVFQRDNGATAYYIFDRKTHTHFPLFVDRPELEVYQLPHMERIEYTTRDGLKIPGYLTKPLNPAANSHGKFPLVLLVHGGPWARDLWGFNILHQFFGNRGYATLSVNFRGSTGFGKNFLNKGNKEWGVGSMQHDLTDAVKWAIAKHNVDEKRVAIYGGSYGGYATLAGLTYTPELYACGVDIVGPSNIRTLFQSVPPYWEPIKHQMVHRVGDAEKDDAVNQKISPLFHVDKIKAPLLIGQGRNDPRVKEAESTQIVEKMRQNKIPFTYVLYPDEGHGFVRPPNKIDFYARSEKFLADHLGGSCEPYTVVEAGNTAVVQTA
eukprot:g11628.t1